MPDPALQRYLAEHYYSGPKSEAVLERYGRHTNKKKKRKEQSDGNGTVAIRDEGELWFGDKEEEDDVSDAVRVPGITIQAPKSGTSGRSGWATVKGGESSTAGSRAPESVENTSLTTQTMDTAAPPSHTETPTPEAFRLQAGLMSREQLKAQREAREAAERVVAPKEASPEQETVYRDAHGRRINLEEETARLRDQEAKEARKRAERMQWNRGIVQRRAEEEQRADLETARSERMTKYVL